MNKLFLFDMDGVLIDTERVWHSRGNEFMLGMFGADITAKIGSPLGLTAKAIFERGQAHGFTKSYEYFKDALDAAAESVYRVAPITPGVEALAQFLIDEGFKIGLVSSSGPKWIGWVLPRLSFAKNIEHIISLNERTDLRPKPHPDGYLEAIKVLQGSPATTIILEDSNTGITAGKASGAFTVAFRQNLVDGYKQIDADAKAETMHDVISIVQRHFL